MAMSRPEAPEPLLFGMERELEYTGHITQVMHFVPLPRRVFASVDETHIRVWGQDGDIVKKTFPSNQRSMVTAMAFCPTFSALITTEVDMTLKLYTMEKLELIDTFSLQQARKSAKANEKVRTSQKVSAMVYFPQHKWVMVGGDGGSDLYRIEKGTTRRTRAVDLLEYHLSLDHVRQVTTEPVSRIVPHPAEQRVLVWGPLSLCIFDMDLALIVRCHKPHAAPVCSASIHVVSGMETALLTGGADGHVNFWVVQNSAAVADRGREGSDSLDAAVAEKGASLRLQHGFQGHSRAVEIVNFYHRLQHGMRQRLCVSYARDSKMKVWSLEHFSLVYTLDQSFLDSRSSIFSLAPHFFAVSSTYMNQDGLGKSATVTLVRFTAHVATPFATTNHSPVVSIAQPPVEVEVRPSAASPRTPKAVQPGSTNVATAAAIISEDMAVRLVDTANAGVIATLPPPPNSKVQVLRAFICPIWQLLVLWLSSEEIAIFFIPTGKLKGPAFSRVANNTTPLLLRRFGIVEVRTEVLDKDLSNEAFHSVALHHGWPLPAHDTLVSWTLDCKATPVVDESAPSPESDWFLVVGTKSGTLQVFSLAEILEDLPVWQRLAPELLGGPHRGTGSSPSARQRGPKHPSALGRMNTVDLRLQSIELEHLEAMEEMRAPGQQPFPKGVPPLRLYGRWRCHDYAVEVTESVGNRLLTVDAKRNLKIWRAGDMACLFHIVLNAFVCHVPYVRPEAYVVPKLSDPSTWRLRSEKRKTRTPEAQEGRKTSPAEGDVLTPSDGEQRKLEDLEVKRDARTTPVAVAVESGSHSTPVKADADSMTADASPKSSSRKAIASDTSRVLALVGLAVGTTGGGIQLFVFGGGIATPSEPRTFATHTAHGAAMVQMDYSWSANVFVSIGLDDMVKLWSGNLSLLRDIAFPAPLTSISFQRVPGADRPGGDSDILVGFAAHVEQVPYETWSRGIPEESLSSYPGQGNGAEEPIRTRRGLLRLDASDNINDHAVYLYSNNVALASPQDAVMARDLLRTKMGVNFGGAALVSRFARKLKDRIDPEKNGTNVQEKPNPVPREGGEIMDFRGPPLVEVGCLSGTVTDWGMLSASLAARESKAPAVDHQRSGVLDRGDFRAVTRCYPQYYDWSVSPNTIIDAPREQALRGVANNDNVALVTSLGVGHLRSLGSDCEITGELDSLDAALSAAGVEEVIDPVARSTWPGGIGPRRPFHPPKPPLQPAEAPSKQPPSSRLKSLGAAAPPPAADTAAKSAARLPEKPAETKPKAARRPPRVHESATSAALADKLVDRTQPGLPPKTKSVSLDAGGAQLRGSLPEGATAQTRSAASVSASAAAHARASAALAAADAGTAQTRSSASVGAVSAQARASVAAAAVGAGTAHTRGSLSFGDAAVQARASVAVAGTAQARGSTSVGAAAELTRSPTVAGVGETARPHGNLAGGAGTDAQISAAASSNSVAAAGAPRPSTDSPEPDEPWRSHFIGRGVPKSENEPKPRAQAVANTERDSARLLEERGNLQDAPEAPEENFLKSLFTKKADWLYYPSDSHVLTQKKTEIHQTVSERRSSVATWTTSGRYVCAANSPPVRAMPTSMASTAPGPMEYQPRIPMTRGEVTEQRLIQAAMAGPPAPVPDLSLYSRESWRQQQLAPPGKGRSSSSSSFGASSGGGSARSSLAGPRRRKLLDARGPALTAR